MWTTVFLSALLLLELIIAKNASSTETLSILLIFDKCTNSSLDYGSLKSKLFSTISLDNKIRYCQFHGIRCIVAKRTGMELSMSSDPTMLSSRILKLYWINRLLRHDRYFDVLIYLDLDTVILDPLLGINAFESEKVAVASQKYEAEISSKSFGLTPDFGEYHARFQSGAMWIKPTNLTISLFSTIMEELSLQATNSSVSQSDQLLINEYIRDRLSEQAILSEIQNVSRVKFNAFPRLSELSWSSMGLPLGDEQLGVSQIIHFAGVFGGVSSEDGLPDPLPTLLAVKGFMQRHLTFLQKLATRESQAQAQSRSRTYTHNMGISQHRNWSPTRPPVVMMNTAESMEVLRRAISYIDTCASTVFTMFDLEGANTRALQCLKITYNACRKLLSKQIKRRLFSNKAVKVEF